MVSGEFVFVVVMCLIEDFGKDVLNKVNIVIVLCINSDGFYVFKC